MNVSVAHLKATAPPAWVKLQENRWRVNNLPAVGHDSNHGFFTQLQINLAGVEMHDSSAGLDKNLGKAGCPHYDSHDCPQGYTCMFAMSNFQSYNIHPGMFHFLELGLYVELVNFRFINFSGLHFHGGSPPRAPPGVLIPDDATRFVNVEYPNDNLLCGLSVPSVLAVSGAGGSRVEVLPGARYDPLSEKNLRKGALNYTRDGDAMMTIDGYRIYIPRQIAILLETILAQSPHLELNLPALKILFKDKITHEVIDYWTDWQYPPGMEEDKRKEMAIISQQVEANKVQVSLSVPTQVRRLYNDNKLKLQTNEDGNKSLFLQPERMYAARKKRKGFYTSNLFIQNIYIYAFKVVNEEDAQAFQELADQEEEVQETVRRSQRLKDKPSLVGLGVDEDDLDDHTGNF